MKHGREIIEQAVESLEVGDKLADATVFAVCKDNSVYWLQSMTVRPPVDAVKFPIEHVAEYLRRRMENGGPLPSDWAKAPPRKS